MYKNRNYETDGMEPRQTYRPNGVERRADRAGELQLEPIQSREYVEKSDGVLSAIGAILCK